MSFEIKPTPEVDVSSTVNAAIDVHETDTTNVHGIVDTSELATKEYVTTEIGNSTVDQSALAGSGLLWDGSTEQFKVDTGTIATKTYTDAAVASLVDAAPSTLNTLNELAAAINDDSNFASTITASLGNKQDKVSGVSDTEISYLDGVTSSIQTQINSKLNTSTASSTYAPINSPTFTGTVGGITKSMVGLANVDNTADGDKPVSTAQQTALDLKAPLANPTFTGTVAGITKSMVGLGSVDNTSDANKPVSTATQTELNLKAPLANPTFTGTVTLPAGTVTSSMIADGTIVDGDISASAAIAQSKISGLSTSLSAKANLNSPTFTGTVNLAAAAVTGLNALPERRGIIFGYSNSYNTGVGESALYSISTGSANTAIGYNSLAQNTSGSSNTSIGDYTLYSNTIGQYNVAIGSWSLSNLSSGDYNIAIGNNTLPNANGTQENIAIGHYAGINVQSGSNNIIIGNEASPLSSSTSNEIVLGNNNNNRFRIPGLGINWTSSNVPTLSSPALTGSPTAPTQSAGDNSTKIATTAYADAAVSALVDAAPGTLNTLNELAAAINDDASYAATITTALGTKAPLDSPTFTGTVDFTSATVNGIPLPSAATPSVRGTVYGYSSSENEGIGVGALYSNTTGAYNTGIGSSSLTSNTSGSSNTAIGAVSLYSNTTGTGNISFGTSSLGNNTSGSYNLAIGNSSLNNNTTGTYNIAIGKNAIPYTNGHYNIAIGLDSGQGLSGTDNIIVGNGAGSQASGNSNTIIGNNATTSYNVSNSISIGAGANNSYNNSILFGNNDIEFFEVPGLGILWYEGNIPVSTLAQPTQKGLVYGYTPDFESDATTYGYQSGKNAYGGTAIGYRAMYSQVQWGIGSVAVGRNAMFSSTTGNATAVGDAALYDLSTGFGLTAIGTNSLTNNTTGYNSTAIGAFSGNNNTTGNENTYVGVYSGYNSGTGSNNTTIGYDAQPSSSSVSNEITLGNNSVNRLRIPGLSFDTADASNGKFLAWSDGSGSPSSLTGMVWVDAPAGSAATPNTEGTVYGLFGGEFLNTSIGYGSLTGLTDGVENAVFGSQSGTTITTGDNNIILGNNVEASSATISNEITIGNMGNEYLRIPGLAINWDKSNVPNQYTVRASGQAWTANDFSAGFEFSWINGVLTFAFATASDIATINTWPIGSLMTVEDFQTFTTYQFVKEGGVYQVGSVWVANGWANNEFTLNPNAGYIIQTAATTNKVLTNNGYAAYWSTLASGGMTLLQTASPSYVNSWMSDTAGFPSTYKNIIIDITNITGDGMETYTSCNFLDSSFQNIDLSNGGNYINMNFSMGSYNSLNAARITINNYGNTNLNKLITWDSNYQYYDGGFVPANEYGSTVASNSSLVAGINLSFAATISSAEIRIYGVN